MTEQTNGADDLSADIMNIFGIGGDEGSSNAESSSLPAFEKAGEVAVPPSPAAAEAGAEPAPAPASPTAPEVKEPAAQPTGTEPAPAVPTALPGLTPAPTPTPAPAPAAPSADMELVSLRAQNELLQRQLEQKTPAPVTPGAPAPSAEPAAGQGSGEEGEQAPAYSLQIPDQVATAIFSDDPATAKAGMAHLVNSLATVVHINLRKEYQQHFKNGLQQLESRTQTATAMAEQAAEADRLKEEYFTSFPTHRDPVVQQIVANENAKLAAEFPGHPFDEKYRAALGARVNQALTGVAALGTPAPAAPAAPVAPGTPVPAKPAAMLPNGRSAGGDLPTFESLGDEVADVFSFG